MKPTFLPPGTTVRDAVFDSVKFAFGAFTCTAFTAWLLEGAFSPLAPWALPCC